MMMNPEMYTGTLQTFSKIVNDEGWTGLFKGAIANVVRTVGAAMILVLWDEITVRLARLALSGEGHEEGKEEGKEQGKEQGKGDA
jgi:hypothetical protein